MKFKLYKDITKYNSSNCVAVWDDVFTAKQCQDIYNTDWGWTFNNRARVNSTLTSWSSDIINFTMGDGQYQSHQEEIKTVYRNWGNLCNKFPIINSAKQSIDKLSPYKVDLARAWFNGQTYGLGDEVHRDRPVDEEDGFGITFIFYCNPEWEIGWGGETLIHDEQGSVMQAISPKPGRLIGFDARLLHKGCAPSRHVTDLRITLAYHAVVSEDV